MDLLISIGTYIVMIIAFFITVVTSVGLFTLFQVLKAFKRGRAEGLKKRKRFI